MLLQYRFDCYTLDYFSGAEARTCQHVYQCSRVPKKEKKIRGGSMPYPAEPLKQWMSRLWKRQFGLYKLIMCGLMLVLCHTDALWVLVSFRQRLLKKISFATEEDLCVLTGLGSDFAPTKPKLLKGWPVWSVIRSRQHFWWEFCCYTGMCFFLLLLFFLHVTEKFIKLFKFAYVCVCIVKCQEVWGKYLSWWLQFLSKSVKWWDDWAYVSTIRQFWKAPAIDF